MDIESNHSQADKSFCPITQQLPTFYSCYTASVNWREKKDRLNPDVQSMLRENAVVNEIQNRVVYANAFELRSFRLRLEMEDQEEESQK
jgi:hypothetical protein